MTSYESHQISRCLHKTSHDIITHQEIISQVFLGKARVPTSNNKESKTN